MYLSSYVFILFQAAVKRFSSAMKYSYEGAVFASLSLAAGGKSIEIKIQDENVVGFGSFGKFFRGLFISYFI